MRELREKKVALVATEQPVDTSTAAGKAFLDMLDVFAEFETNLCRERQMEGIARAKERGVYKGRKPKVDVAKIRDLQTQSMGPVAIAAEVGVSRSTVWRVLSQSQEHTLDLRGILTHFYLIQRRKLLDTRRRRLGSHWHLIRGRRYRGRFPSGAQHLGEWH